MAADETDSRYRAALEALASRGRFGMRLGLGRTRALLRRLGDPQLGLPGVLIGGTNGKGSVQALVASVLQAAGERVGQTPKPHLVSYRERLVVDGRPIAPVDFADLVVEVIGHADALTPRLGPPTEFEVLTAAAFEWFRRAGVTTAVVEVGMGGRLDATNAWQGGVSAITNVALDHTEHLGPTVVHIAREKAAIIKRGDRAAVTGADDEALPVISRRARRLAVPLRVVRPLGVMAMGRGGLRVADGRGGELQLGLLGRHQAANAAVALAIIEELASAGMARVHDDHVAAGLAAARWPGRLELLALAADGRARPAATEGPHPSEPDILLDGAHNPHGAVALGEAFRELRPLLSPGRPTLLIGVLADKDVSGMLTPLAQAGILAEAYVVATDVPDSPRALPAAQLADAWTGHAGRRAQAVSDPAAALDHAAETARRLGGPLVICGSLYLVGFVRGRLLPAGDAPRGPSEGG